MEVLNELENVSYNSCQGTEELKEKFETLLSEKLGDITFSNVDEKGKVDFIEEDGEYGFAFAFSKFDDSFREDSASGFRYKDSEVKSALKEVIKDLGMKELIKWDRGSGVFVFNVFVNLK